MSPDRTLSHGSVEGWNSVLCFQLDDGSCRQQNVVSHDTPFAMLRL